MASAAIGIDIAANDVSGIIGGDVPVDVSIAVPVHVARDVSIDVAVDVMACDPANIRLSVGVSPATTAAKLSGIGRLGKSRHTQQQHGPADKSELPHNRPPRV